MHDHEGKTGRLCLAVMLCILIATWKCFAFGSFYSDNKEEGLFLQAERRYAQEKQKVPFVVYDNFNSPSVRDGRCPLICKPSRHFIPADQIDFNITVHIGKDRTKHIEESISDLIYANLRLKKLLEEYAALRKKARELLGEKGKTYSLGFGSNQFSIHRNYEEIDRQFQDAGGRMNVATTPVRGDTPAGQGKMESMVRLLSQVRRSQGVKADMPGPPVFRREVISQLNESEGISRNQPSIFKRDEPLPWVIRSPLKLLKYLLSHKGEAAAYGAVLFFGIFLVLGGKSGKE